MIIVQEMLFLASFSHVPVVCCGSAVTYFSNNVHQFVMYGI